MHKLKPLSETPPTPDFWQSSAVYSLITTPISSKGLFVTWNYWGVSIGFDDVERCSLGARRTRSGLRMVMVNKICMAGLIWGDGKAHSIKQPQG